MRKTSSQGPSLLVPINLTALCVSLTDSHTASIFTGPTANFDLLPYRDSNGQIHNAGAYISENFISRPFSPLTTLDPGIHLHWALPDALTHGTQDPKTGIQNFPNLPNRWLVVRVLTDNSTPQSPKITQKSWIIVSDNISPEPSDIQFQNNNTTVPISVSSETDSQPYQYLGKVFDASSWSENPNGNYWTDMTALGFGQLQFSSLYPNSRNVFGMYDSLGDIQSFDTNTCTISYILIGWYSDISKDPVANNSANRTSVNPDLWVFQNQSWSFVSETDPGAFSNSLYHGAICNIQWDPNGNYFQETPNPINISIGTSLEESISALISALVSSNSIPNDFPNFMIETVLNALQLNLLGQINAQDGLFNLEEALHQNGFGSSASGKFWNIKSNNTNASQQFPNQLGHDLNQLNILQKIFDDSQQKITHLSWQIFSDWYKYMISEYATSGTYPDPVITIKPYIENEITNVLGTLQNSVIPPNWYQEEVSKIGSTDNFPSPTVISSFLNGGGTVPAPSGPPTIAEQLSSQMAKLITELGNSFILSPSSAPRFWQPKDPVLLLNGNDVSPALRYGGDNLLGNGNLPCRLDSQINTVLTVAAGAISGSSEITLSQSALPQLQYIENIPNQNIVELLFSELFFLDPSQSNVITSLIQAEGGNSNPGILNFNQLENMISKFCTDLFNPLPGFPLSLNQLLPAQNAIDLWSTPWLPIFMDWELEYIPVQYLQGSQNSYHSDFIESNFTLSPDNVDYQYSSPIPSQSQIYSGSSILTPDAGFLLQDKLKNYEVVNPDPEIQAILQDLNGIPVLAQSLNGFNNSLVMRRQTLQFNVVDPIAATPLLSEFSNVTAMNAVGSMNITAPSPEDCYNPIRGGMMKLLKLRLIDTFGRIKDIYDGTKVYPAGFVNFARSESLVPNNGQGDSNTLYLAPRISQGSRLLFQWIAADNDQIQFNPTPANSPICGWILPNNINYSLMVYDSNGNMIGSLLLSGDGSKILWQSAPGNNTTFNKQISNPIDRAIIFANTNHHLENFVLGLYGNSTGFFKAFFAALDRTVVSPTDQSENQSLAVLIGRPLALVRASLDLQLQGLPLNDQSWPAFQNDLNINDPTLRTLGGFTSVEFPVRLGDLVKTTDGLIGYFTELDNVADYQTFYAQAADDSDPGVIVPPIKTLTLTSDPAQEPISVTMLIDPHAEIHATTGILPVTSISIPSYQYSNALSEIVITILGAPVLLGNDSLNFFLPQEIQANWNWIQMGSDSWTIQATQPDSDQASLSYTSVRISEGWLECNPNGTGTVRKK